MCVCVCVERYHSVAGYAKLKGNQDRVCLNTFFLLKEDLALSGFAPIELNMNLM